MAEWQEYLKLEPDSDEAYFYLGASYLEEKQLDTAILNFEKCLPLNPNNAYAHLNLGILYDRHRNDLAQATEHLEKAKALGGVEKYTPERIQAMIQDLQDRMQLNAMQETPFAVEHKHVFSSCRGSLRITDEGVEFKTDGDGPQLLRDLLKPAQFQRSMATRSRFAPGTTRSTTSACSSRAMPTWCAAWQRATSRTTRGSFDAANPG